MNRKIETFLQRILRHEGGFSLDRNDPGNWTGRVIGKGELKGTKYGISAASYPTLDIRGLDWNAAKEIYERDYWVPAHIGEMPDPVAFQVFDAAINSGPSQAIRWLQRSLVVTADGIFGPITASAVSTSDRKIVAVQIVIERHRFMRSLPTWKSFGPSWSNRLLDNLEYIVEDCDETYTGY